MGAQSSHHEPLNVGGIPGGGGSTSLNNSAAPVTGPAPDFNRVNNTFNASMTNRGGHAKVSLASKALNPRSAIRRSLRKRKEKRQRKKEARRGSTAEAGEDGSGGGKVEGPDSTPAPRAVAMDRLRRSLRDSFRKKKDGSGGGGGVTEASRPHLWQHDEDAVRKATCAFPVKYLGCVEVFESRGMQVCEEALKVLRASRRRPIKGMLHVSGDGLRVVDDDTKGLLVDQTIEKVSFCAPDRNHERGFSYICRDGTTRRWMCHGFVAIKETGERLSHAVGCAFAACLERKQKRDRECGVTMTFDQSNSTFTRMGSFKQMSITDRLTDPQECKPNGNSGVTSPTGTGSGSKAANPHAIARPHATPLMLQRQGSCRVFHHLNQSSPFKRQLSLRLNDLPSNLERQRSHSLDATNVFDPQQLLQSNNDNDSNGVHFPTDAYNNNGAVFGTVNQAGPFPRSKTTTSIMSAIPESGDAEEGGDSVSAMCQQLSQGLLLLSSSSGDDSMSSGGVTHGLAASKTGVSPFVAGSARPVSPKVGSAILVPSVEPIREEVPWSVPSSPTTTTTTTTTSSTSSGGVSKAEEWLAQLNANTAARGDRPVSPSTGVRVGQRRNPPLSHLRANSLGTAPTPPPPAHPPWVPPTANTTYPPLPSTSTGSFQQPTNFSTTLPSMATHGTRPDVFDAEWIASLDSSVNTSSPLVPLHPPGGVAPIPRPIVNPNNPFLPASTVSKAFEVQM